jgi:hypothetical protein
MIDYFRKYWRRWLVLITLPPRNDVRGNVGGGRMACRAQRLAAMAVAEAWNLLLSWISFR